MKETADTGKKTKLLLLAALIAVLVVVGCVLALCGRSSGETDDAAQSAEATVSDREAPSGPDGQAGEAGTAASGESATGERATGESAGAAAGSSSTLLLDGTVYDSALANDPNHVHVPVKDAAVEPTCQSSGLSEGSHCSECGAILEEQSILPTVEHRFENGVCVWCHISESEAASADAQEGNTGLGGPNELPIL